LFPAALLGSCALLGVGLALLGAFPSAGASAAAAFLIGLAEGYLTVEFITWLQLRTSREELGRMMGILLFASLGQAPLSNVIAGTLMGFGVPVVMIAFGGFIVLVALIAAFSPSVWQLRETPALAVRKVSP
jgi:putative flippase GtrA